MSTMSADEEMDVAKASYDVICRKITDVRIKATEMWSRGESLIQAMNERGRQLEEESVTRTQEAIEKVAQIKERADREITETQTHLLKDLAKMRRDVAVENMKARDSYDSSMKEFDTTTLAFLEHIDGMWFTARSSLAAYKRPMTSTPQKSTKKPKTDQEQQEQQQQQPPSAQGIRGDSEQMATGSEGGAAAAEEEGSLHSFNSASGYKSSTRTPPDERSFSISIQTSHDSGNTSASGNTTGSEVEDAANIPEAAEVVPEAADVVPEAADVVPEAADVVRQAADVVPEAAEVVPEAAKVVPEAAEVVPALDKLAALAMPPAFVPPAFVPPPPIVPPPVQQQQKSQVLPDPDERKEEPCDVDEDAKLPKPDDPDVNVQQVCEVQQEVPASSDTEGTIAMGAGLGTVSFSKGKGNGSPLHRRDRSRSRSPNRKSRKRPDSDKEEL